MRLPSSMDVWLLIWISFLPCGDECGHGGIRQRVHLEHVEAAARAGKHIICEKPLEVTTARIDQMIKTCDEAGVMLKRSFHGYCLIHPQKFFSRAIENGRLGKVVLVDVAIKWWRSQEYYDSGAWRGTWELDGGA